MKGNFARWSLCSGTTSVDLGLYSSIVGLCCDCCVWARRGHKRAVEAVPNRITATLKMMRREFIRQLPGWTSPANSFSQERSSASYSLTRHHSSLQGKRDICLAGPSVCTMKLSEKLEPMPCSGSYNPGSTENAMPGSSMV